MDYEELAKCNFVYLKEKATEIGIPVRKKKTDVLYDLTVVFKEHEAKKQAKKAAISSAKPPKPLAIKKSSGGGGGGTGGGIGGGGTGGSSETKKSLKISSPSSKPTLIIGGRFIRGKELRPKTKDSWIYEATDTKTNNKCIVKCFRCDKAASSIERELEMHKAAQAKRIAPAVIHYDNDAKKIFYDHADMTLNDYLSQGKLLTRDQQNRMLQIMRALDDIGVLYADPHPTNFLMKGNTIYTIEFTNSKKIDTKIAKKLDTNSPNRDLLLYKFVKYLKEMNIDQRSYTVLSKLFN